MPDEPALLDTNIFVYAAYLDSPHHAVSRTLLEQAQHADANFYVVAQSLAEFYAVVTNPRRVTIPKTTTEAIAAIEAFLALPGLMMLPQPVDVVTRWCQLLRRRPVTGSGVFDLQLIAAMMASGVRRIYTFNAADFKDFSEIEVATPS